jgi:hypothetical protein
VFSLLIDELKKRSLRDTPHARGWMQGNEKSPAGAMNAQRKNRVIRMSSPFGCKNLKGGCFAAAARVTCGPS